MKAEERFTTASGKLEEASKAADESERGRRALENKTFLDDGRIEQLEAGLKQTELIANEAERKYDEVKSVGIGCGFLSILVAVC